MEKLYEIIITAMNEGEDDSVYFSKLTDEQAEEVRTAMKEADVEGEVNVIGDEDISSHEEVLEAIAQFAEE